jgi:DNA-directed RNA polymerase specialized sigma24 family protein
MAGQRPLLERAAAGDREAFALLYDDQVEAVYGYLLAWTGNPAEAASLTRQVFHTALAWLPSTTRTEVEAGAWLIAMARDAVAQRGGAARVAGSPRVAGAAGVGGPAGPTGTPGAAAGAVAAVARLGDPEREVVVLRLLLGHSLAHTAHLSGYSQRAVMELQLAACLSIQKLTDGTHAALPAPEAQTSSAEEFERRLGPWDADPTGSDPALAAALTIAGSLRQATPGSMASPDPDLVDQLRHEVVTGRAGTETAGTNPGAAGTVAAGTVAAGTVAAGTVAAGTVGAGTVGAGAAVDSPQHLPLGSATFPLRGPQQPEVADAAARVLFEGPQPEVPNSAAPVLFEGAVEEVADSVDPGLFERARPETSESAFSRLFKRPWVATAVATAGIVVVLALQAFGKPAPPGTCDGRPCPASTTAAVAAAGDNSVGTPLSTVLQPTTTSTTLAGQAPAPTAPPTSAATAPPTTRPATTAAPTTAPRPTTTRAPTTTAPPTTAATTTTTAATATT